jgi:hypothetical protein
MTAQADFVQPPRIAVWLVNLEREENSIHVKV